LPHSFQIDRSSRRVTIVGSDPVALPDVLALLDRQIAEGAWSYGTLHDARSVSWQPTADDVRMIVAYVDNNSRTLGPRGSVAFVAGSGALSGMAQMYSKIVAGSALHAEVFADVDSARRWLDEQASK
jgi:hypothetical protein